MPVAVGKAALSGEDMYMSGMRGKCVNIIHTYKDTLWGLGDVNILPPVMPLQNEAKDEATGFAASDLQQEYQQGSQVEAAENASVESKTNESVDELAKQVEALTMTDEFLQTLFLAAIKFKTKEYQLPVIVSTFMKLMQSCW